MFQGAVLKGVAVRGVGGRHGHEVDAAAAVMTDGEVAVEVVGITRPDVDAVALVVLKGGIFQQAVADAQAVEEPRAVAVARRAVADVEAV